MILTGLIASKDGMGFSLEEAVEGLGDLYEEELKRQGDRFEVLEVDDLTIVQRGETLIYHGGVPLDHRERVYLISNISTCPLRQSKLRNIYHMFLELGVPLLNRSFAANPELEVNKMLMHAVVSRLGIPCIPTVELHPQAEPSDLLALAQSLGIAPPIVLKPNRLAMGFGIIRCDNEHDFKVKVGLVRRLTFEYLIQPAVPNSGDLRVYVARDRILGHQLRIPRPGDFRANRTVGGTSRQIELSPELKKQCLEISSFFEADFIALDWLQTETGFLFGELASTLAGFQGLPREKRAPIASAVIGIARRKLLDRPSTSAG